MSSEFIAALGGGIVTGVFALLAVFIQGGMNRTDQKRNEQRLVLAILQAIQNEIDAVWNRYMETAGGIIGNLQANMSVIRSIETDGGVIYERCRLI